MDNVTLIRVVSGILAVVVLFILIYRMRREHRNRLRRLQKSPGGACSVRTDARESPVAFSIVSFMAKRRGERQANPGAELRAIRQQLGWSLREIHAASVALAKKRRQPAFVIPPSRLHDIESKNKIPSIHRLYALALIYGRTLKEILSLYGIPL